MKKNNHKEKSIEERKRECNNILEKYPDRICVYIEKNKNCKDIEDLEKKKYLIPKTLSASQFIFTIRSKLQIPKNKALFFYVKNNLINGSFYMNELNNKYKNEDGFLYINYTSEACFG